MGDAPSRRTSATLPQRAGRRGAARNTRGACAPRRKLGANIQREADRVALNRYAPTGVLINAESQVLQFRGDTSPFLKPPSGHATFNVLKMAREGLMLPLRAAINQTKEGKQSRAPRECAGAAERKDAFGELRSGAAQEPEGALLFDFL